MKELLYFEIRKLMRIKVFVCVTMIVMLCPMLMAFENVTGYREVNAYKEQYAQEITPVWLEEVTKTYDELQKEEERLIQESNGTLISGAALSEDKQNLQRALTNALSAGYAALPQMHDRIEEEDADAAARKDYVTSLYPDDQTYFYGDPMGGDFIITSLWYGGIILGIYMIYLFSRLFNMEDQEEFYELLKTTTQGKRRVGKAKLCIMLSLSFLIAMVYVLLTVILAVLFLNPQWNVILAASCYGSVIPYLTFGDAVMIAVVLFFTVLPALAVIASLISTFIRSTFVSLMASLLLFLIPIFMQHADFVGVDITTLMPSSLALFNNNIYHLPYRFIQGHGFLIYQVAPILWMGLSFLFCIFIYIKFQRRAHI